MKRISIPVAFLLAALPLVALSLAFPRHAESAPADPAASAPASSAASPPDDKKEERKLNAHAPADIVWGDGPPSLPAGAKAAVLEGDPKKEGPFVIRLRLPDGYRIPPHTHPKVERLTVISGTFNLGFGVKFDPALAKALPAGTYAYWSPGMEHFASATGETVVQVHGTGPWSLTYVNPDDDPRNAKK